MVIQKPNLDLNLTYNVYAIDNTHTLLKLYAPGIIEWDQNIHWNI